jgi:hypothetical protein
LRRHATPGQANAWPVFAALYLVIFAFFILLVAVSHPDVDKTEALVESVREALQPGSDAENDDALFVAGRSAMAELAGDLQPLLRIARVERSGRGEELRLSIRESDLYAGDAIEPAFAALPMLDRIVAALNTPPPGLRLTLTLTLPMSLPQSPGAIAPEDGAAQPLTRAARRAAAFADALIDRGSSPKVITVGVAAAQDQATIVFRFQRNGALGISDADAV